MKFVLVKKGSLETKVPERALNNYIANGWHVVEEKDEKVVTYDDYTKKQLLEIASNRNLYTTTSMNKQEIIDILIDYDNLNATKPSNKGFTDNLIKQ